VEPRPEPELVEEAALMFGPKVVEPTATGFSANADPPAKRCAPSREYKDYEWINNKWEWTGGGGPGSEIAASSKDAGASMTVDHEPPELTFPRGVVSPEDFLGRATTRLITVPYARVLDFVTESQAVALSQGALLEFNIQWQFLQGRIWYRLWLEHGR
jgi:hypothetical protein